MTMVSQYWDMENGEIKYSHNTHLNLLMATAKLMSYVECDGVFHIYGTHVIAKNRFLLDVFLVKDMRGQLHLIAFM